MKMYLLTGVCGHLGNQICRMLIDQNRKVRVLAPRDESNAFRIPLQAEIITGEITDYYLVEEFFNVPDNADVTVIHCASMESVSPELSVELISYNVGGTRNIINACIKHKVNKLIYVSSVSAIPLLPNGEVTQEIDSFNPYHVTGFYGQSKAMASQLVLDAAKNQGLDASIVYPSCIIGPGDYSNGFFTKFFIDYMHGKVPLGIDGNLNTIDVKDLAEGVLSCAEKGRKGEGYIMSNNAVSTRDIYGLISRYSGAKNVNFILSIHLLRFLMACSSFFYYFIGKPKPITGFSVNALSKNNTYSSEKAERELGFRTRPFEETIFDLVNWLHNSTRISDAAVNCANTEPLAA